MKARFRELAFSIVRGNQCAGITQPSPHLSFVTHEPVWDRLHDDGRRKDVVVVALPLIGVSQAAQDPESSVGQDDAGGRFNRRTKWLEFWLTHSL